MRYSLSNIINKPLEVVVEKFKEPEGAKEWMPGLQTIEPISGEPLAVGSKTNFTFLHKNKEMKIEEIVLEQDLPNSVKFGYKSSMGYNEVEMRFRKISENETEQVNESYFELKGFMSIMGFLFKGMFKKQTVTYMEGFKNYCEK